MAGYRSGCFEISRGEGMLALRRTGSAKPLADKNQNIYTSRLLPPRISVLPFMVGQLRDPHHNTGTGVTWTQEEMVHDTVAPGYKTFKKKQKKKQGLLSNIASGFP